MDRPQDLTVSPAVIVGFVEKDAELSAIIRVYSPDHAPVTVERVDVSAPEWATCDPSRSTPDVGSVSLPVRIKGGFSEQILMVDLHVVGTVAGKRGSVDVRCVAIHP